MALLIGTDAGVARVDGLPFEAGEVEPVLDCGAVQALRQFDAVEGAFVAADAGLFRSLDGGDSWTDLGVPAGDSDVWSVVATADGRLLAGTNDPALYRSLDGGGTWHEVRPFRRLPTRGVWESPVDPHRARLRTLASPPDAPGRVVAGIESGGVHVGDRAGEEWADRRDDGPDDVHQVLAPSRDVYVAATGHLDLDLEHVAHGLGLGGLYRTTDAGRSWTRLDVGNDYSYTRSVFRRGSRLLFGAATAAPGDWFDHGADAALFEAEGLGRTYERVDYPGEPHEVVEAFADADGKTLCGTAAFPPGTTGGWGEDGRVLRRTGPGAYETVGRTARGVRELLAV